MNQKTGPQLEIPDHERAYGDDTRGGDARRVTVGVTSTSVAAVVCVVMAASLSLYSGKAAAGGEAAFSGPGVLLSLVIMMKKMEEGASERAPKAARPVARDEVAVRPQEQAVAGLSSPGLPLPRTLGALPAQENSAAGPVD